MKVIAKSESYHSIPSKALCFQTTSLSYLSILSPLSIISCASVTNVQGLLKMWFLILASSQLQCLYFCKKQCMAEDLLLIEGTKEEQYQALLPQIKALVTAEEDLIANLANIAAALKQQFGWLWVGFYLVKKDELVLAPFQGPVACTRIKKGRGVCGKSWELASTLIVPDVEKFPGHIACSSLSKSEIVLPLLKDKEVLGVLDIDSEELDTFDTTDQQYLESIIGFLAL